MRTAMAEVTITSKGLMIRARRQAASRAPMI
jgi:hypothetical protein